MDFDKPTLTKNNIFYSQHTKKQYNHKNKYIQLDVLLDKKNNIVTLSRL
jgi:hypothetical protein